MPVDSQILYSLGIDIDQNSTNKAYNGLEKTSNKVAATFTKMAAGAKTMRSQVQNSMNGLFAGVGLSLGVGAFISAAHSVNQEVLGWHNNMNVLSDSFGDTGKAVGVMTSAWGKSIGGMAEVQNAMKSLNEAGLNVTRKGFEDLTISVTNLSQASGIGSSSIANMLGSSVKYWDVSNAGAKEMVSSVIAAGEVFDLTNNQLEKIMNSVTEAQANMGAMFSDGEASSKALAKGLTSATGALTKMGVSAEKAGSFMNKLLDPEQMGENNALMRRLGITFEEQIQMMESAGGKELFFDKLMTNLPKLSQQIQSIRNPMARLKFAKNLGLPLEIASKMAKSTGGEIRNLLSEYKDKAKQEKSLEKKQEKAKANAARFQEQLDFMKMKILMPLMKWLNTTGYKVFGRIMKQVVRLGSFISSKIADMLNVLGRIFEPFFSAIEGGGGFDQVIVRLFKALPEAISRIIGMAKSFWAANKDAMIPAINSTLVALKDGFFAAAKGLWEIPEVKKIIGALGALKALSMIPTLLSGLKGFSSGLKAVGFEGGIGGLSKVGFGKLGLASKALGSKLLSVAGPLAAVAAAAAVTVMAFKGASKEVKRADETFAGFNKNKKTASDDGATGRQKFAAGAVGALTLGMFDDKKTQSIVRQMSNQIDTFEGKRLKKELEQKIRLGEATKKEKELYNDLIKSKNGMSDYVGSALAGGAMGAAGGAAVGGTIGTAVPILGNAIGAAIGGILGAAGGSMAGMAAASIAKNSDHSKIARRNALQEKANLDNKFGTKSLSDKETLELAVNKSTSDSQIGGIGMEIQSMFMDIKDKTLDQTIKETSGLSAKFGSTLSINQAMGAGSAAGITSGAGLSGPGGAIAGAAVAVLAKSVEKMGQTAVVAANKLLPVTELTEQMIFGADLAGDEAKQYELLRQKKVEGKKLTDDEIESFNMLIKKKSWSIHKTLTMEERSEQEKLRTSLKYADQGIVQITKKERQLMNVRLKELDKKGDEMKITIADKFAGILTPIMKGMSSLINNTFGKLFDFKMTTDPTEIFDGIKFGIKGMASGFGDFFVRMQIKLAKLTMFLQDKMSVIGMADEVVDYKKSMNLLDKMDEQLSVNGGGTGNWAIDRGEKSSNKAIRELAAKRKESFDNMKQLDAEEKRSKERRDAAKRKENQERNKIEQEKLGLMKKQSEDIKGIGGGVSKIANKGDGKKSGADFLSMFNKSVGVSSLKFTT